MSTANLKNQKKPYKIKASFFSALHLDSLHLLNAVLKFFSLKDSKQFWGIVYDSVSKQPLDPVIVKLLYIDGREVETCITDIAGRYGFLATPGKFKIYARKTNYKFPSEYAIGDSDGVFKDLYHGEFFVLDDETDVIAPNIPMDPVKFDWNQQAKQEVAKTHPYLKYFLKKLIALAFWFGLFLNFINIWQTYPKIPIFFLVTAGAYVVLLFLAASTAEVRLWGQIKVKRPDLKTPGLILELYSRQFSQVSFGKAMVHPDGRFLLRTNKGKYQLSISEKKADGSINLLGKINVTVGRERVLNSAIYIQ
jgi:hypothetical protein